MQELKILNEHQKIANVKIDDIAQSFVTDEVIAFIKTSTSYQKILKSNDPVEFMDIPLIQWDTCTSAIMCILRKEMRQQRVTPTQSLLIRICKLAARKILVDG